MAIKDDVLMVAIKKAKAKVQKEKSEVKETENGKEKEEERLLEVLKEELGIASSKMAEGDPVEFTVLGNIKLQDDKKFGVVIKRVSIPKENVVMEKPYPRPSPSA